MQERGPCTRVHTVWPLGLDQEPGPPDHSLAHWPLSHYLRLPSYHQPPRQRPTGLCQKRAGARLTIDFVSAPFSPAPAAFLEGGPAGGLGYSARVPGVQDSLSHRPCWPGLAQVTTQALFHSPNDHLRWVRMFHFTHQKADSERGRHLPRAIQPVRRSRFKPLSVSPVLDVLGCGDGGREDADTGWEQNG